MKTKLLIMALLAVNLTFSQANLNQSNAAVQNAISQPIGPQFGSEIFRFRAGLVTQLDSGSAFNFTSSQWFAQGRLTAGTQTFYGLRFQQPNKSLLMGYSSASPLNPVIQWIGTSPNLGNLEFRVANTFGAPGAPGADVLVATMTKEGSTVFGSSTSAFTSTARVRILNEGSSQVGTGLYVDNTGGQFCDGIFSIGRSGSGSQAVVGVRGITISSGNIFEAGIYGECANLNIGNQWGGFFDGDVYTNGIYQSSDFKLKDNIKLEVNALEKIAQLKPVTYNYKKINELHLSNELQHGFVAQDLAIVFPELTKDISKPVFDKEGKSTESFDFKSVNYTGLISVLTAGINELNEELKLLKEEITTLKNTNSSNKTKVGESSQNGKDFFMEQNIPNPFSDQTTIRFQLPNGSNNAEVMVFDLNGNLKKSYPINKNQTEITIKSSDIGKGLFIYSLVQNGQEMMTKKMIVK